MSHDKSERDALSLVNSFLNSRRDIIVIELVRKRHKFVRLQHVESGITRKVVFASTPSCNRWLVHLKKDLRKVVREIDAVLLKYGDLI